MIEPLKRAFWSAYGYWAWDQQAPAGRDSEIERLVRVLASRTGDEPGSVLDAGCGTGACTLALARAGFRVVGVDSAPGMLQRARLKRPPELAERARFDRVDLNRGLPYPDATFDHVMCVSVLQAVADVSRTVQELARVVKPGGTLWVLHTRQAARASLRERVRGSGPGSGWILLLAWTKAIAERVLGSRTRSLAEIREALEAHGFQVEETELREMWWMVARRKTALTA